jgi:hypothetical protein
MKLSASLLMHLLSSQEVLYHRPVCLSEGGEQRPDCPRVVLVYHHDRTPFLFLSEVRSSEWCSWRREQCLAELVDAWCF